MEKRLRSSLRSSAEEFVSVATKLNLKSAKSTLKPLVHSVNPSSEISSSLPLSLFQSISKSIRLFRNGKDPNSSTSDPNLSKSPGTPPSKRLRRSSRRSKTRDKRNLVNEAQNPISEERHVVEELEILCYILLLCVTHPKRTFSSNHLLLCAQELHDNLIFFESESVLLSEIATLCEEWWKGDLAGKESLITQFIPYLLSRSLTSSKKVDVHRVYVLREALTLFDYEDQSIEDLKLLLIRCVIAPLYLKIEDGRRFVAFLFGLSQQLLKEALAMIRSQIPFGRKSMLEAYGDILFRAWRVAEGESREELEDGFLQSLVEGVIYGSSAAFSASIRRILGGFINQRTTDGVEKLLFRLVEPVIFRSLQVANSNVRQNALHLLLDMFPLENPDATKEVKDTLLNKQFFLIERLLIDDCPDVRVTAVEGCCRLLHLFWEIIPSSIITKTITKIFDDMSHDICSEVRLSSLKGMIYLFGNPQSHEVLKVLLPRFSHLMLDNILSIRVAFVDLLLLLRDTRSFQFNKVVELDVLLDALANDQSLVGKKITRLLMPSYFPSKVSAEEACKRCVTLIKRSPMAGANFCQHAVSEGASLESVMELVRSFSCLALSSEKLDAKHFEGLLLATEYLCSNLVSESRYKDALKELFDGERLNSLFAVAPTRQAQSSIFNFVSTISPDDASGLLETCMSLITHCSGLPDDKERQVEVKAAQKLLLSCDMSDYLFDALTVQLHKAAYHCHIKFGTEVPKLSISLTKKKKCNSLGKFASKFKHFNFKKLIHFEEDYLVAAAVSWQIKDLLVSEDSRNAILGSQSLGSIFLSLKVISEISIVQCMHFEFVDAYAVMAHTALALHCTLQDFTNSNTNISKSRNNSLPDSFNVETILEQTMDHLLTCSGKLFESDGKSKGFSRQRQRKRKEAATHIEEVSSTNEEKKMLNKVKILMVILKFIVDTSTLGFIPQNLGSCLKFTSEFTLFIISILREQYCNKLKLTEEGVKDLFLCVKSSFTYASKLLSQAFQYGSRNLQEEINLANNLLDLIVSTESYLSSGYAAHIVAIVKPWLPDLILGLVAELVMKQTNEEGTSTIIIYERIKSCFPSWLLTVAKIEWSKVSSNGTEEEDRVSKSGEFPTFNNLLGLIITLLKGDVKVMDAIGAIFLTGSTVGLQQKEFELVFGLVHFVCEKLFDNCNEDWGHFTLKVLQVMYPQIKREIKEQCHEDVRQQLHSVRALLEPIWMHHVL